MKKQEQKTLVVGLITSKENSIKKLTELVSTLDPVEDRWLVEEFSECLACETKSLSKLVSLKQDIEWDIERIENAEKVVESNK